ncbi:MAG: hypothetical protein QXW97_01855 [Candidatus Pacearchaeota archaeon]
MKLEMIKKKKNTKSVKRKKNISNLFVNKNLKKESSKYYLFGIKVITLLVLLLSLYCLILFSLYIISFFVKGSLRDYMLTGIFDKEYFISRYGIIAAENFILLIGAFVSLFSFIFCFWFSLAFWKRKNWARITIGLISLIIFVISLMDFIFVKFRSVMQIITILITGFIFLYLFFNKKVVEYYTK